jgi:diamine N-acetyltransferase
MQIEQALDSEIITKLNRDIQELHVSLYPDRFKSFDFNAINEFFKRVMENPKNLFLIIKDNDQYLGYVWLEFREYQESAFTKSSKSIFVHHLSILKEHQNKGYGSMLMDRIYKIAENNSISRIELDYWSDNEIAKRFYEKNEFIRYREFVFKEL